MVAKVPAYLPHHGGNRKAEKAGALFRVKTVDRIQQAHSGNLDQVFEIFTTAIEMTCDIVGQRQASGDYFLMLTSVCVTVLRQAGERPKHLRYIRVVVSRPAGAWFHL
ncbi:hypothetical protein MASB_23770 [Mycobacteroides abscessus subsp. bolletii BD]|nr:hypothetical protein MASB_23770 [Mycobacteroides abscessus subsp. bolletii BD]